MNTLDDILAINGEFEILLPDQSVKAIGHLELKERIVLSALVYKQPFSNIIPSTEFRVCGNIGGTEVTLLDCLISAELTPIKNADYCTFLIVPSEIIVGKCYTGDILISEINSIVPDLNYMGLRRPDDQFFANKHESLANQRPSRIEACDSDGKISIFRKCSQLIYQDRVEFKYNPILSFSFNQPHKLFEAKCKVLSARNLLTFFADHYIAITCFRFTDASDLEASKKDGTAHLYKHLYNNYQHNIDVSDRAFLLRIYAYADNFQSIWLKWQEFYRENSSIYTLFYEIICNRSTYVNCFLNLTQALEIYSSYYRKSEVKLIAKEMNNTNGKVKITLRNRIEDILLYTSTILSIDSSQCGILAKYVSDVRNYYTHYKKKNYKPTINAILAANNLLRYILLIIVFKHVGIPDKFIAECKQLLQYSRLKHDVAFLLSECEKAK